MLGWNDGVYGYYWQPDIIPPWWTLDCDVALRGLFYRAHNTLVQGAIDLFIQNVLSTPYEISGGRNKTYQWQEIFWESEFGEGYDTFLSKVLLDALTLNRGGFVGISAYGDADQPINDDTKITGLYHLDALRLYPTGNLEYPYYYQSEVTSTFHRLHKTRVYRLTNLPTPDARLFGMGLSPLYKMVSQSNAQIMLGRLQNEQLNDLPPSGAVLASNIKGDTIGQIAELYEADRIRDGQNVYRAPITLESLNPNEPADLKFIPFAMLPPDFNYQTYLDMHVNLVALSLGIDPQDVWPLSGQALGTGTQSKVLQSKAKGKGYGYMLKKITRIFNKVLPKALEYKSQWTNEEADKEEADKAQTWFSIADTTTVLTTQEKRQLIANQVPAVKDILFDEAGNVRLYDEDIETPEQIIVADDEVELAPGTGDAENDVMIDDTDMPESMVAEDEETEDEKAYHKDYSATSEAFVSELATIISDANSRAITRPVFSARTRAALSRYGQAAYRDGLAQGGVEGEALSDSDKDIIAGLLSDNSGFITDLGKEIYSSGGLRGTPETRASMWDKSLSEFYFHGTVEADRNGLYQWELGSTKEHCRTCRSMSGQKHRMKDYLRKGIVPRSSRLACNGYNCKCTLSKTTGAASGNW